MAAKVDISIQAYHERTGEKRATIADGTAVLMISSELPEILAMSHRIMVMQDGRVAGILERAAADQVTIMGLAAWTRS